MLVVALLGAQGALQAQDGELGAALKEKASPVFSSSCITCHSAQAVAGGLNIELYLEASSVAERRAEWQLILQKMESGEMPPPGMPRPNSDEVSALASFVRGEFDAADARLQPDPGRVTARRLNRVEYSNTIRDLLGVKFDATNEFPSDDRGHGFDTIGDVLTVSPLLMEKYLSAAESISARALGVEPLPAKPIEVKYLAKEKSIQRIDVSTIAASHRVGWDADYVVRIDLPGERPGGAPVELGLWMDGELLRSIIVDTKPMENYQDFSPMTREEVMLFLPAGDHVFRAGFINDDFPASIEEKSWFSKQRNKFPDGITFIGPYKTDVVPPSREKILICDPNAGRECVERIISTLARRTYRRPPTTRELNELFRLYDSAQAEKLGPERGIQISLMAMLVSPHFLFRVETNPDPQDPERIRHVTDLELASRLSYFLWSSMPDEELLGLAETGKLSDPQVLYQQVERMLADKKAASLADDFAGQWLQTRNLYSVEPNADQFPEWDDGLRDAMMTETSLFFQEILDENRPLGDFLDADFTFLNARLAKLYDIEGITGSEFRKVELPAGQRGGLLGQASVLTVTSYPSRTSPTVRGKYILENILGTPPPPPPPNVPTLEESSEGSAAASLRQQMQQHRSNPVCASCHARMDVLGFGLENYDAIGRWRTEDGPFPIDSSGVLPSGESFAGPAELKAVLAVSLPDFARCVTEKMLTYALGRGLGGYDRVVVKDIVEDLDKSDYRFRALIHEIVNSLPFRMRNEEVNGPRADSSVKEIASR